MFARHITKDISAYCHRELSNEGSKRFAEHIISCVKCRTRFEEVKLGVKLAEQLPQLSAPEHLWRDLEPLLATEDTPRTTRPSWAWQLRAAAVVLLLVGLGFLWFLTRSSSEHVTQTGRLAWQVKRLGGTPRIGAEGIANDGQLEVGEWLETDGNSSARIAVGSIGNVDIEKNTRVRLLETQPTEHRLELARGKMSARIWAPPRLFFVDTPSAVAADLGCAYTLEVDDSGGSILRVTSGWVALELKDRESIVPAGASCETRPVVGPGTPYFEDSSAAFREALQKVDFDPEAATASSALTLMLHDARPRDTLTLWHLLSRVDGADRVRVLEKMTELTPPPPGVTREGILRLDRQMLEAWKRALDLTWRGNQTLVPKPMAEAYWRLKSGLNRKLNHTTPK